MNDRHSRLQQILASLAVLAVGPLTLAGCKREPAAVAPHEPETEQSSPAVLAPELEPTGSPNVAPAPHAPEPEAACAGEIEASCAGAP